MVSLWRYRHFSRHVWRRRKDLYVRLHIIAVSRKQGMCQNLLSLFLAEIVSKWFKSSSSIVVKIEIIILLANLNVVLETFLFLIVDLVGVFLVKSFRNLTANGLHSKVNKWHLRLCTTIYFYCTYIKFKSICEKTKRGVFRGHADVSRIIM